MWPCAFFIKTVVFNMVVIYYCWRSEHSRHGSHGEESLSEAKALLQSTQSTLGELHKEVGPSCAAFYIWYHESGLHKSLILFLSVSSCSQIRQVLQLCCPPVCWKWPSRTCLSLWRPSDTSTILTLKGTAREPLRPSVPALVCFNLYISFSTSVIR